VWISVVCVAAQADAQMARAANLMVGPMQPILPADKISVRTLGNGLRVLVRESHAVPVISLQVWVRAGSRYESRETNGVFHLMEHMVFRGSQNRRPDQVNEEIEGVGGYTNAETTRDSCRFFTVVPSMHFQMAAEGYADALLRPVFREQTAEVEKRAIALESARRGANPIASLEDMTYREAFQVHSYGLLPAGDLVQLDKITLRTLREYHQRFFVASNMIVIVAGDIDATKAFSTVDATFGSASASPAPDVQIQSEPALTSVREITALRDVKQAAMAIAMHAPGIDSSREVCAMDVLLTVLGEGKTSRLQKLLKQDAALVSEYQVDFLTQKDPGLFVITCVLSDENIEKVKSALLEACMRLSRELVGQSELVKAKALLEGQYAASNETADGQAGSLGFYEVIDSYLFATDYVSRIHMVTAEDVRRVAQQYFSVGRYTMGLIRPKKALAETVRAEGIEMH